MPLISEAVKWMGRVSLISEVVIRSDVVSDFGVSILENECCSCTQRKESVVTFVALTLQVFMCHDAKQD